MDVSDERRFREIIKGGCKFARDWNDDCIKPDMLRIFSKRKAVDAAEKKFMKKYVLSENDGVVVRKAVDEESSRRIHSQWLPCSKNSFSGSSSKLNQLT